MVVACGKCIDLPTIVHKRISYTMTVLSKLSQGQRRAVYVTAGASALGLAYAFYKKLNQPQKAGVSSKSEYAINVAASSTGRSKRRVAVDGVFFARLRKLLAVVIPGVFSPEAGYIALVAIALVARTYCDLWMINKTTEMEAIIINRDRKNFPRGLVSFFMAMIPIATVNNILKFGLDEMGLRFRNNLSQHLYKDYLKGFTYYKINNLDNRISNPDQLLTQDVDKFCHSITDLYSNISKPLLDIVIYAQKLTGHIGAQGPFFMLLYLVFSGVVLTILRKPTARFTIIEQRLEGEFRFVNSRLITNSEEIAFYQGNEKEKAVIDSAFGRLVRHLRRAMRFRYSMGIVDHIIGKYVALVVGFFVVSRPFMDPNDPKMITFDHEQRMNHYYESGRMLMNLASAVGRLILAGRELTRLAGFTARVTELTVVLSELNEGKYQRTMVASANKETDTAESLGLKPNSGVIHEVDHLIEFVNVPLVTPNGDVLIRSLTFKVESGINVLVCGPNGCGKSSLFRSLGELWPLFGGELYKPAMNKLFYVPQRPYMTLGTLRDQIIYPDTREDAIRKGMTDEELANFLEQVHLSYLTERPDGWDAVCDWMDVLSGGEKQRVAMARLFYHKPQFAILDECTSAVSVDVEGFMYTHCRKIGITLFTVSHRKSLWKYHEKVLYMDGRGGYEFNDIGDMNSEFGS